MRLLALFLRTRRAVYAILGLVAVTIFGGIWADWLLATPQFGDATGHALIPAILLMPLISASVIGAGIDSPIGELEQTASQSLPRLRALQLLLLGTVAVVGFWLVAQRWDLPQPELMLIRNLAGFVGLALLSARFIGGRLAWGPPLAFAILTLLRGHGASGEIAAWAWSLQPGNEVSSIIWVLGLLLAGTLLIVWKGSRISIAD